jgi:uncharacterized protein (TIGR03382 family)
MLRRATLLLSLLPGIALGQVGSVAAFVTSQGTTGQANRTECASTTSVATWTIASTGITFAAGDKWRLSTSQGACSTTVPTTFLVDATASTTPQTVTGVFVQQMGTEGSVSCTGANDQQINLCVYYVPTGTIPTNPIVFTNTFNFQTAVPPAPTITGVSPGDSQLSVSVVPGTATSTETANSGVTYTVSCAAPGATTSTATGNAGNIVCSGLTNGLSYAVTATGRSAAGNSGATSATYGPAPNTTPLPFVDFWNTYKNAPNNGVEQGGCGTGGAGAIAPALALLALLLTRRRRP